MKASQAEHTIIPSWSQLLGAQLPSSLVFLSRGISGTCLVSLTWWQSSTRSETKPSIMRFTVSLCWHGCVVELFFNPDINSLLISFALIKKSMNKSSNDQKFCDAKFWSKVQSTLFYKWMYVFVSPAASFFSYFGTEEVKHISKKAWWMYTCCVHA